MIFTTLQPIPLSEVEVKEVSGKKGARASRALVKNVNGTY